MRSGEPARERLTVRKVFRRRYRRGGDRYVIAALDVPFCGGCTGRHRRADLLMSPLRRALTYLQSWLIIPAVGAGYLAVVATSAAVRSRTDGGAAWAWGVVAFLVVIAVGSMAAMVRQTRRFRVLPQTEVTLALDHSDELGSLLEGYRRVYAARNDRFADAFLRLNGQPPA